jgi:hypothetical protein
MILLLFLASLAVVYYIIPPLESGPERVPALPEPVASAARTEPAMADGGLFALGRALEGEGRGFTPGTEAAQTVRNVTNSE